MIIFNRAIQDRFGCQLGSKIRKKEIFDSTINLKFKSKGNLVIPKLAYLSTFREKDSDQSRTLITVIHHSSHKSKLDSDLKTQSYYKTIKNGEALRSQQRKLQDRSSD